MRLYNHMPTVEWFVVVAGKKLVKDKSFKYWALNATEFEVTAKCKEMPSSVLNIAWLHAEWSKQQ